jgi:Tfp pilus assembly protein FimV
MADEKNTNPPSTDPDDEENVVIDTTSTEPLRNAKIEEPTEAEADSVRDPNSVGTERERGFFTAPKFGSAGSGGAELEPGPGTTPDRS